MWVHFVLDLTSCIAMLHAGGWGVALGALRGGKVCDERDAGWGDDWVLLMDISLGGL